MKIYITDLTAYNAGTLVGKWIELPMDKEELAERLDELDEEQLGAVKVLVEDGEDVENAIEIAADEDYRFYDFSLSLQPIEEALAMELADYGVIEVPEKLEPYIDWEKLGRDIMLEGRYLVDDRKVYEILQ